MPRFLISDEFDLNTSTSNLFFDPLGKKREASNSLEKLAKEDNPPKDTSNPSDRCKILSYNISKKGMLQGNIPDGDEVEECPDDSALVMNSPSERYIYDHPKKQIKYTLEKWVNNRYCTNQMVSKLIN